MRGLLKSRSCSRRIFRHTPRATCAAAALAATFRISRSLSPPCLGTTRTGSGVLHARLAEIPSCSQRIFRLIPRATCAAASLAATFRISRSLSPPCLGTTRTGSGVLHARFAEIPLPFAAYLPSYSASDVRRSILGGDVPHFSVASPSSLRHGTRPGPGVANVSRSRTCGNPVCKSAEKSDPDSPDRRFRAPFPVTRPLT